MRVDFYILQGEANREMMACRLCEKAWQQGLPVFVLAQSAGHAQQIDDLLWTFNDGGFLPHQLADQEPVTINNKPVITIGWQQLPAETYPVLINLSETVPDDYSKFERVAEIVNQNESVKQAGRQRFTRYRNDNCDLHHHEL
ncbi:MAG: DNA polymerase III subunit chi [Gammaproteobacteria bacterium]|nr:DNA polymerase III subunit chi [Gammaproteobacteria bacterium]